MKASLIFLVLMSSVLQGCAQSSTPPNKPVINDRAPGGNCEICDGIYESPVPFAQLNETDTLSCFLEAGPKLYISGRVLQQDEKTPAPGVVLYFYQTNLDGVYPKRGNETGFARQHGYLRGWLRTNEKGEYHIYTQRPGSYPNSRNPAHIHVVVKEEAVQPYWIDDFLFADDPYLAGSSENKRPPRGGSGVLTTTFQNGILLATRDIVLRKNVE